MLKKTRRAERGELHEASVVQTPRARIFAGVPNAALGCLFYPALALAIWLADRRWEALALLAICALVALVSLFLAYSLLFVTRMPCKYCWTAHITNWALTACTIYFYAATPWR